MGRREYSGRMVDAINLSVRLSDLDLDSNDGSFSMPKMGDHHVFVTPQQNVIAVAALLDTLAPILSKYHMRFPPMHWYGKNN